MLSKPGHSVLSTSIARIVFGVVACIYCFAAHAASALLLDEARPSYSLGELVEYIEDSSGQLDIKEIARQPESAWNKHSKKIPNFGFTQSAYWFRIQLQTNGERRWLLDIDYPLLDEIAMYTFDGARPLQTVQTGDTKPFAERPLKHVSFVLPLTLQPAKPVTLYLRVKSMGTVQVPIDLWQEDAYYEHYETITAIEGIYFGVVLIMVFYNLFFYLMVREPAYIHYVLFVTMFGLFTAELSGWGYRYLWPEAVHFQQYSTAVFLSLSLIFASRFIHHFLDLPHTAPRVGYLLLGVVFSQLATLMLLPLIGYHLAVQFALAMTMVTSLTALYAGIRLWRQGEHTARYFTIAWSSFLFSTLLATLEKFGFFPSTFWADFFLPLGVILIVSLLSIALAARLNIEKQQRIQAQQQIIMLDKKNRAELEQKINERTVELAQANADLQLLATTDSLTGIFNRRHFLDRATQEMSIARRYQRPLALVMLDIDYFKAVNDTYGHDVGDRVLQHLVSICRKANRETDVVGRLGGEEFGILLLNSPAASAHAVAERLRREIEKSSLEHEGARITITVSQGVCAVETTQPQLTVEQMLKVADNALYQAKHLGRNQVVVTLAEGAKSYAM